MKIAFVHDWILTKGGAEKVFFDLIKKENFQQAKVFTVFSKEKEININNKKIEVKPLISSSFIIDKIGYRNLFPIYPLLTFFLSRKIKKFNPKKTVISSFAIAKNISINSYKQLYLHSPMQYIRDSYEEYVDKLGFFKRLIFKFFTFFLRKRDKRYNNFDKIYFNSFYTKKLANSIYNIDGDILYPNIEEEYINTPVSQSINNYYVFIGRLVKFSKELDKIIDFFNQIGENLLIIGEGVDEEYLKSIAKDNIVFLGNIESTKEKIKILKKSMGLINITKESFGIVTAEALSLGVPVFGYNQGATPELVDKNSGILVDKKDYQSLTRGFLNFHNASFDRNSIKNNFLEKYEKYKLN